MNSGAQTMKTALSFGAGVDSSTILAIDLNRPLAAQLLGITLEALNAALPAFNEVVFADTGAESAATMANLARFQVAAEAAGKSFLIVKKQPTKRAPDVTITDWLMRLGTVPVMGGGKHICSKKWKGEAIEKAIGSRNFIIGIEANEGRRLVFDAPKDGSTFCHPLVDLGITREMCLELLPALGFAGVEKSSCVFCPFKSEDELRFMFQNDRAGWALCEQVEASFQAASSRKHQLWLDNGKPTDSAGRALAGMWRLDSWKEGRRLFVKKIEGRQLSMQEWAQRFESEQQLIPLKLVA
jgi:hypothetical protein